MPTRSRRPSQRKAPRSDSINEIAITKPRPPKISKTDLSSLNSIIGNKVDSIQDLLESGNLEAAGSSIHMVLLQTLVDVIPQAEHYIREEGAKKGVYQMNALTSMILETLNSARALNDRGQIAQVLLERVIQPNFKEIAESVVREFMALEADLSMAKTPEEIRRIIQSIRGSLSASIQNSYSGIRDQLHEYMSG